MKRRCTIGSSRRGRSKFPCTSRFANPKDELEEEHALRRHPEGYDRGEADGEGEEEFARVEAQRRGDMKVRVRVMNLVQPPEDRHLVVGAMPEVGDGRGRDTRRRPPGRLGRWQPGPGRRRRRRYLVERS
jgi:hypothetical protein